MITFAFLSFPECHKLDEVYQEACQSSTTQANDILQQDLGGRMKWVYLFYMYVCVDGSMANVKSLAIALFEF